MVTNDNGKGTQTFCFFNHFISLAAQESLPLSIHLLDVTPSKLFGHHLILTGDDLVDSALGAV
jgi:hypothetical protein